MCSGRRKMPKFSLLIRCEEDGDEHVLTAIESDDAQQALDLMMTDLKALVEEYEANPSIHEE
jgi:hypothetical protein